MSAIWFRLACCLLAASLAGACRIPAGPTPATPTGAVGYLEGHATIGPLRPVEQVGVPPPTPSPQVCTARGLSIFEAAGQIEVTSFSLRPDCTYRAELRPGKYVVRLRPGGGIEFSKDLPRPVEVASGQTTRLDVAIDTGIR